MIRAFYADCTPGYYNNEGQTNDRNASAANSYAGGPHAFFQLLREWRDAGDFRGLSLTKGDTAG
jgi:cyclohexanone monooxygenase